MQPGPDHGDPKLHGFSREHNPIISSQYMVILYDDIWCIWMVYGSIWILIWSIWLKHVQICWPHDLHDPLGLPGLIAFIFAECFCSCLFFKADKADGRESAGPQGLLLLDIHPKVWESQLSDTLTDFLYTFFLLKSSCFPLLFLFLFFVLFFLPVLRSLFVFHYLLCVPFETCYCNT